MAPIRSTQKRANHHNKSTVGVYLRLRPIKLQEQSITKLDEQQVKSRSPDGTSQIYAFTQVFDNVPQSSIFTKVARPIAEDLIMSGKDGLIFTYGITGSGKTYTMEGLKNDPGLIYRTIDFLFNSIGDRQTPRGVIRSDGHNSYHINQDQLYPNLDRPKTPSAIPSVVKWQNRAKEQSRVPIDSSKYYCVFLSLIELYNKQVHDLFEDIDGKSDKDKKRREIRTDKRGVSYVANANQIEVKSADDAVELYTRGIKRRKTGATALNQDSSRGHCVLNLTLVSCDDNLGENSIYPAQLCLVDLAGSERSKRSGAKGETLYEAGNINNSLGALRNCIKALRDRETTVCTQYRQYTLTRLFKSYFEGQGTVTMILCVKPAAEDFKENELAMDFGLLTKDVAIDYASPAKMPRTSEAPLSKDFFATWLDTLKRNRLEKRNILKAWDEDKEVLRHRIDDTWRRNEELEANNKTILNQIMGSNNAHKMDAMKIDSMHSPRSRPLPPDTPPSTTTASATNTSSTDVMEYPEVPQQAQAPYKTSAMPSPVTGRPFVNPRYSRSLSCSSIQWLHHRPEKTLKTGTILTPKCKNGTVVKKLRSRDILRKDVGGYSIMHQDADSEGDVKTSVHKGPVIPTVCGGAQVTFQDIEVLTQGSPKRTRLRSASDAHYKHIDC